MEFLNPQNKNPGAVSKSSTQQYVDVEEIRDGTVVLKNGSLRAILLVSSLNFDLKSSEEQEGIILQYQNFLNSLDFPVQIVVSSRRLNIEPYLALLSAREKGQENDLLRSQIAEYRGYVKELTEVSNIMSKYFYVVVPFSAVEDERGNLSEKIFGLFRSKEVVETRPELFETYRSQLLQRVGHVVAALSATGVHITMLQTEEVIELLYNSYNPSVFSSAILKNIDQVELK
ncbi:MAG: hypothetical protein KA054_00970 [Candidatus Moranbacteria bacterium]|nr:hypothetical protein [Candidatus Moranbacteria bacterium]